MNNLHPSIVLSVRQVKVYITCKIKEVICVGPCTAALLTGNPAEFDGL